MAPAPAYRGKAEKPYPPGRYRLLWGASEGELVLRQDGTCSWGPHWVGRYWVEGGTLTFEDHPAGAPHLKKRWHITPDPEGRCTASGEYGVTPVRIWKGTP